MSDEIKVGDVCEIVALCCGSDARSRFIGMECAVVKEYDGPVVCGICRAPQPDCVVIAIPALELPPRIGRIARRAFLRKKRPPADDAHWIRQETVPLERFNEWREKVREAGRVEEPA